MKTYFKTFNFENNFQLELFSNVAITKGFFINVSGFTKIAKTSSISPVITTSGLGVALTPNIDLQDKFIVTVGKSETFKDLLSKEDIYFLNDVFLNIEDYNDTYNIEDVFIDNENEVNKISKFIDKLEGISKGYSIFFDTTTFIKEVICTIAITLFFYFIGLPINIFIVSITSFLIFATLNENPLWLTQKETKEYLIKLKNKKIFLLNFIKVLKV